MKSFKYLYGPVPSRRLGRSLGIDLVPHKICTYDCIYCQIGKTTQKTLLRKEYVLVEEVLEEVDRFLKAEHASVDFLSLSGSGEPTLHSKIGLVINGLKELSSLPIAVITNGSLLFLEEVQQELLDADVVLPSLDAVSSEAFLKMNRPLEGFSIEKVIEGLVQFRKVYGGKIWLEILFCRGVNDHPEELNRMREAILRIQPDQIHLNTVVRPPSETWAMPLSQEEMEKIRAFFGEKAILISEFDRHPMTRSEESVKEEILNILRRRPLSLNDLARGMGIRQEELKHHLGVLLQEGTIRSRLFGNSLYYELSGGQE